MPIALSRRPGSTVDDLRRDVADAIAQMKLPIVIFRDVSIGTSTTAVAHGLSGAPQAILAMPQADARVWRAASSDAQRVYLKANTAVLCDVVIFP